MRRCCARCDRRLQPVPSRGCRSVSRCLDHHLHPLAAVVLVDAQAVGQAHARRQRLAAAEPDRVAQRAAVAHARASGASRRPGAARPPRPRRRTPAPRRPGPRPARRARAPSSALKYSAPSGPSVEQRARQRRRVEPFARDLLRSAASKRVEVVLGERAAGRHRVAAEALQHAGVALAHQVERVAQVKAGDRAARALEQRRPARARRRRSAGAARSFRRDGDDADHALVEARGRRCASAGGGVAVAASARSSSASACSRMPASTSRRSRLMRVEHAARARRRAPASSVSRHSMPSVMSDSRPAALMRGPSAKPKSKALARARVARRRRRTAPPRRAACARRGCACRPCATRRRLLASSLHHVGHGAERDQVEQRVEPRLRRGRRTRRARAARRAARAARRTSRRRRRGSCSRSRSRAGSG